VINARLPAAEPKNPLTTPDINAIELNLKESLSYVSSQLD
jgi:hypothetical protein